MIKTEILAPEKFFAHNSDIFHPIWLIFGPTIHHALSYVSAEGFPATSPYGPAASPKTAKIHFSSHNSAILRPIATRLGRSIQRITRHLSTEGHLPAPSANQASNDFPHSKAKDLLSRARFGGSISFHQSFAAPAVLESPTVTPAETTGVPGGPRCRQTHLTRQVSRVFTQISRVIRFSPDSCFINILSLLFLLP